MAQVRIAGSDTSGFQKEQIQDDNGLQGGLVCAVAKVDQAATGSEEAKATQGQSLIARSSDGILTLQPSRCHGRISQHLLD